MSHCNLSLAMVIAQQRPPTVRSNFTLCVRMCIHSVQLLNGCQQKSKSVSGEEFSEIEERLRDTMSRLSAMEQERDELAQQNYELKQQVHVGSRSLGSRCIRTYVHTRCIQR